MALESNLYSLHVSRQTAKGTPNTAGTKRLIQVTGDIESQRADSSEAFSDLDRFGNQTDFVNTLIGAGSPGIEGQSDTLAYLCWLFFGGETFTAGTGAVHTLTKGTATTGNFDLTIGQGGGTGVALSLNIATLTAAQLQTALTALPNIVAAGGVTCGGGPLITAPITITFPGGNPVAATVWTAASNTLTPLVGGTAPTDAITTPGVMAKHQMTPQAAGGYWTTWMSRVGASVIKRNQHSDARISTLSIEGSTAAKVVRVTPTIMALAPGVVYTADPAGPINLNNVPFLYTDGGGAFTIDGVVFQGQTQFNVTWDEALTAAYGDSATAFDLVPAMAKITVAATIVVDLQGYGQYCKIIYGTSTPTPGQAPLKGIPNFGSYQCTLTRSTGESFNLTIPGVHWAPGLAIAPNPQGGIIDLALAGEMRKVQGLPGSTVTIMNPDNATYTT